MVKGFPYTLRTCKYLNLVFLSPTLPKYAIISSKLLIWLLPIEKIFSFEQLNNPSTTEIWLLYRDKSVRLTKLSNPYIFLMLLNDKSNHFILTKCPKFSIFSITLLSSCNFSNLTKESRYWIFQISKLWLVFVLKNDKERTLILLKLMLSFGMILF